RDGLVLSMVGMDALKGVEGRDLYAVAGPGLVTAQFQDAVEAEGWFYGPDPSSWQECTLGGNAAANAGGPRAFKYGVTRDWVLGMEVVRADGTVLRIGRRTRKGVTGYDLTALIVGSEGTLGVITELTLRLVPKPEQVVTVLAALSSEADIAPAIDAALRHGVWPRCVELLDAETLPVVRPESAVPLPDAAQALLILELDGHEEDLPGPTRRLTDALDAAGALDVQVARSTREREALWSARRKMSRTLRTLAAHKMSEDVVVPRSRVGELLRAVRGIARETGIRMPAYGHAGDGNLHVNFLWDAPEDWPRVEEGIGRLVDAVLALGGTLSGEHGIGVLKAPFLPREQSPELIALQESIKRTFDPRGVLNPGKIFPAGAARWHGAC
ncbi:MAG TPA: FAD-linked oxidase C-terminal domain-containing protein, partial [Polyangiaceae bacterium LLY-WYZ-14_1]|nr:FAD-linked oxidase C-terminal domain-containing protein [Polyangiaceae bacterium LLY-WYZ-14_1]